MGMYTSAQIDFGFAIDDDEFSIDELEETINNEGIIEPNTPYGFNLVEYANKLLEDSGFQYGSIQLVGDSEWDYSEVVISLFTIASGPSSSSGHVKSIDPHEFRDELGYAMSTDPGSVHTALSALKELGFPVDVDAEPTVIFSTSRG